MTKAVQARSALNRWAAVMLGLALTMILLAAAPPAYAHDGTSEALSLAVEEDRLVGTTLVAFTDVGLEDTSGDGLIDEAEFNEQKSAVSTNLVSAVRERTGLEVNGAEVSIVGAGLAFPETDRDGHGRSIRVHRSRVRLGSVRRRVIGTVLRMGLQLTG